MIDMITRRVLLIPLTQSQVEEGARFTLDVTNDTDEPMDVFSSHLIPPPKLRALPFYETINIVTLQPRKSIRFSADVIRGNGGDDAAFATAFTAISIPLDERPREMLEGINLSETLPHGDKARVIQSSSVSNPHVYQIVFDSVGKGNPTAILARAVASLIARTQAVARAQIVLGQERQSGGSSAQVNPIGDDINGLYTIKLQGETKTIGELFTRCCFEVFPHIDFVSCDLDDLTSELVIRVRTLEEPIEIIVRDTIAYAVDKLNEIARFL
jgi:hypothetical protein